MTLDACRKTLPNQYSLLYKKNPRANECGDYRTISLMPHITKLFLRIILNRIKYKIDNEIGEEQFGFRANNGTREATFCFNIISQKFITVLKEIYACFIDYSKAFDRVHHSQIVECLEKIGIDGKDIRIITNLYWQQKAAIRIQGETSQYTSIERGVRQGCRLSPYLFNIYTEFIFRKSEERIGINLGGRNINNLRYADDTVLMAEKIDDLQTLETEVKANSKEAGLDMNINKTKVMVVSKNHIETCIIINDKKLEQVETFKYLVQKNTGDGKSEQEIKERIGMAKTQFIKMRKILTSNNISIKLRLRLVKCYILTVLTYNCETWTFNKNTEKRIEAFEMWLYRRLGKISWTEKNSNKEVCNRLSVSPTLLSHVQSRKLKYFRHFVRHDSLCKHVLEGKAEGKRQRGRQQLIWTDDIKSWTDRTMQECMFVAKKQKELEGHFTSTSEEMTPWMDGGGLWSIICPKSGLLTWLAEV